MFDGAIAGLGALLDIKLLAMIFAATIAGVLIGALPGLGATSGAALLLPFTVTMPPVQAIAILSALYCAATYAGSITAILINTPGTSAAAATCIDGYPMAQRGEAGRALGMATVASTIGGIFSVIVLAFSAPLLAKLAYQFGPPEYFALSLFGLSMLASISAGGAVKNLIGGVFGVLLATIGIDKMSSVERFTFGSPELAEGIHFIPVLIGLFALSELLVQSTMLNQVVERIAMKAVQLPTWDDYRKTWRTILRSCGIGTFIGVLPAEGATVASMIGYNEARRWSKNKDEFGKGAIEGIAGAEAANNAATGGAMVPTLALGIPGSATTAIILAAMLVHGIRPGPALFTQQAAFVWAIFGAMFIANVMFFGLGLVGAKLFARVTLIPNTYLWPGVFLVCVVGAYALDQSMEDVWIMLVFGLIGYTMRRLGFSVVPVAIGLILGELVETTLRQSLVMLDNQWWQMFTRPIAMVFFVLTVLGLASPVIFGWLEGRWRGEEPGKRRDEGPLSE